MMLAEFQSRFLATLAAEPSTLAARIYRNNYTTRLIASLQQTYPVVEHLVGEAFFHRLARDYIAQEPSYAADLNRYGRRFAEFIRSYPAVHSLSYLPDVATLEWLVHESSQAPDSQFNAISALLAVTSKDYGKTRFIMHPALKLYDSKYPIDAIWQSNQPGAAEQSIALECAHVYLLLCRPEHTVEIILLDEPTYVAMHILAKSYDLESAVEAAGTLDAEFDIRDFLKLLLAPGVASGVYAGSS